jgi:GTP-binding protein
MPFTAFGRPIVVMNKADRSTAKPEQVDSDLFDLFATLGATDEQMEYPCIFASAKQGWASLKAPEKPKADTESTNIAPAEDMIQLFDLILKEVPAPTRLSRDKPFSMLTTQIDHDPYVGMLYLGRVESGMLKVGDKLIALAPDGTKQGEGKVTKIFGRVGLDRAVVEQAGAGEIVSIAGISKGGVNCTLVSVDEPDPKALPVRRPSLIGRPQSCEHCTLTALDATYLCSRRHLTRPPSRCLCRRTTRRSPARRAPS